MLQQFYPFLASLGWAIINSLWQCAALWLIYKFVFSIHTKASAREKNFTASFLLFVAFGWFMTSFAGRFDYLRMLVLNADGEGQQSLLLQSSIFKNGINFSSLTILYKALLPYLSILYLGILLVLSVRLIRSYRFTQKLAATGLHKTSIDHRIYVRKVADWLGIKKEVKVYLSELIDVPATIGYLKPVILLPVATFNNLSTEQAEAILLHELAHISRNDYLMNLFVSVLETILFFNPFARLLSRIIRKEREHSCDDLVLQFGYHAQGYAHALLTLEQQRQLQHQYAMAATGKENELLSRVKRIMNIPYKEKIRNQFALLLFVIAITCFFSLAWTEPLQNKKMSSAAQGSYLQKLLRPARENTAWKQMPDIVLLERRSANDKVKTIVQKEAALERNIAALSGLDEEPAEVAADAITPAPPNPPVFLFANDMLSEKELKDMSTLPVMKNIQLNFPRITAPVINSPAVKLRNKKDIEKQVMLEMKQKKDNDLFIWDFEADKEAMEEYQRSVAELQKSMNQHMQTQKKLLMEKKLAELNKEYELKALQSVAPVLSRTECTVNMDVNNTIPVYREINPMVFVQQDNEVKCNDAGKKDVNVRIFRNGTVIVTIAEEGNVNSKVYTIERKKVSAKAPKVKSTSNSYSFQVSED